MKIRFSRLLLWFSTMMFMNALIAWPQERPSSRETALSYIDGIEALESGDFKRAVASLARAIEVADENASYYRARGVANTLAENFPAAIADLQRALKLQPQDRESKLWLGAAYRMSGDAEKGAQYFTHGGDVPADYASLVYNDMAMDYFSSRYRGNYFDRETKQSVKATGPVKKLFPDVARAYAARHKATGAAANDAVLARMKASVNRGDWSAASRDLVSLRREKPDDPQLRGYWATCLLGLGNAYQSREEFTRVLCVQPLWADGYLGRAQAAAILGDSRRATSDLEFASTLNAKVAAAKEQVAKLLAQKIPDDAVGRFAKNVEADSSVAQLADAALAVHRRTNARRLRFDEAYQDRIRSLNEAIRAEPKNADWDEWLARFLYNHYVVPVVWNGPRGGGEQLRPQSPAEQTQEMQRVLDLSDAALKLNNRHANAMATKGWLLYTLRRGGEAERLADQGLSVERKNVRLLNLKGVILLGHAGELEAQAAMLKAGRTEISREHRVDGEYEVRKYYPPSAEQLAQAAVLEGRAAAIRKQAQQLNTELEQVKSQIIPGLLRDGDKALADGNVQQARRFFSQIYSCNADLPELPSRLAQLAKRQNDARAEQAFSFLAEPMRHTTAANDLKSAWEQIVRTEWNSASATLDRAGSIDPADARIAAYRSVIAMNRPDNSAAGRQRRASLALEEARARLMGSTMNSNAGPIELQDAGLTLVLRLQEGQSFLAARENEKAMEAFAVNLALEARVSKERLVELMPTAMLPDPSLDSTVVPLAPTFASLLAWSRMGNARALLALGKSQEAQEEFRAVRAYLAKWPPTAKDRETMNVVDSWARLGQAEAAVAAKDYDAAFKLLMSGEGWPWGLPQDLEQRRKALSEQVVAARRAEGEQEFRIPTRRSANESRVQTMRQELERLEGTRDDLHKELSAPNLSAREKETLQRSIATMEKLIAAKKAALPRTE